MNFQFSIFNFKLHFENVKKIKIMVKDMEAYTSNNHFHKYRFNNNYEMYSNSEINILIFNFKL